MLSMLVKVYARIVTCVLIVFLPNPPIELPRYSGVFSLSKINGNRTPEGLTLPLSLTEINAYNAKDHGNALFPSFSARWDSCASDCGRVSLRATKFISISILLAYCYYCTQLFTSRMANFPKTLLLV